MEMTVSQNLRGVFWFKILMAEFNLEVCEGNTKCWYIQSRLTSKGLHVWFLKILLEFGLSSPIHNSTAAYV